MQTSVTCLLHAEIGDMYCCIQTVWSRVNAHGIVDLHLQAPCVSHMACNSCLLLCAAGECSVCFLKYILECCLQCVRGLMGVAHSQQRTLAIR